MFYHYHYFQVGIQTNKLGSSMMQPHPEKALGEAMEKGGKKMIGLAKDEPCEYGEALCLFGESACQVGTSHFPHG